MIRIKEHVAPLTPVGAHVLVKYANLHEANDSRKPSDHEYQTQLGLDPTFFLKPRLDDGDAECGQGEIQTTINNLIGDQEGVLV